MVVDRDREDLLRPALADDVLVEQGLDLGRERDALTGLAQLAAQGVKGGAEAIAAVGFTAVRTSVMSGPTWTPSWVPRPMTSVFIRSARRVATRSARGSEVGGRGASTISLRRVSTPRPTMTPPISTTRSAPSSSNRASVFSSMPRPRTGQARATQSF